MLLCLRVKNLAIIDSLEVELPVGLNVLTGETGAGKSILVTALSLVLGRRAAPEMVRTGASEAEVEALFDVSDHAAARERAREMGVEVDEELVLRRVIQASGRTRAFVNGKLASASQLAELAKGLCDISSQHEHHTLVDAASHVHFLDAFAELGQLVEQMQAAHRTLSDANTALREHAERTDKREEREDLLRYQIR